LKTKLKKKINIYCITNKPLNYLENLPFILIGVGESHFNNRYIVPDNLDNIYFKEKYYSELTYHYWFWKNELKNFDNNAWIGFCQKRRFWIKKNIPKKDINFGNLKNFILLEPPEEWKHYNSVICDPIYVNGVNKVKLLKRGFKSLIHNPRIFFNKEKQTVKLHFDMHHGYGYLDKAINLIDDSDRDEFRDYVENQVCFNPNIMFIAKVDIANQWFGKLFPWLFRCEKIFGFENLKGYDTQRLYAYLAERYLSFWFKKHSKYIEWPYITFKNI
jgi:hypothetical protein